VVEEAIKQVICGGWAILRTHVARSQNRGERNLIVLLNETTNLSINIPSGTFDLDGTLQPIDKLLVSKKVAGEIGVAIVNEGTN
jgi:hypothetical protein